MEKLTVKQAPNQDAVGKAVTVQGWVRTRRDSKVNRSANQSWPDNALVFYTYVQYNN